DQVALEDPSDNLVKNSKIVKYGLSSDVTQSSGESSDTSKGYERSWSSNNIRRSEDEDKDKDNDIEHKYHADGSLSIYKAIFVANERTQHVGVDCDDTCSSIVKQATIGNVLILALSHGWLVYQLDVKNAFLNINLSETIYIYHPLRLVDSCFLHHVCQLRHSLYGLKEAPYDCTKVSYLLIYADDIVLTTSSIALLQCIISFVHQGFEMMDLGALNYFLGYSVTHDSAGMIISQRKYGMEILEWVHMVSCNPSRNFVNIESKLDRDRDPVRILHYTRASWVVYSIYIYSSRYLLCG
nr:hypothetical protein [Tanacetum cinerariifolium]